MPIDPHIVLEPSITKSLPGAYFIGPFGRRVSFASQQRRVLNTIWALEETGKLQCEDRVAIVGAGLAGVTAAIGLASRGMNVFLYEASPNILSLQSQTNHRFVHPSINFWPEEKLETTTYFPFFDWTPGICDRIVGSLKDEWENLKKRPEISSRIQKFIRNAEVEEIVPELDGTISLVCTDRSQNGHEYKAVIVSTGFGEEKIPKGVDAPSYWQQDPIEHRVRDGKGRTFFVSGIGDGGLIDALRLVHKRFDMGTFCVEIAHRLDESGNSDRLKKIEINAKNEFSKQLRVITRDTTDEEFAESLMKIREDLSHKLNEDYTNFLKSELHDTVEDILDSSLIVDINRRVNLVGETSYPYYINSAPIHRLLIAHAIDKGAINYDSGRLESTSDGKLVVISSGVSEREINADYIVARHGSEFPIKRFFSNSEDLNDLRARQEDNVNWLAGDLYPIDHFCISDTEKRTDRNAEYIHSRLSKVKKYSMDYIRGFASARKADFSEGDPGQYVYEIVPMPEYGEIRHELLPKELFRVSVVKGSRDVFLPGVWAQEESK
jgi:hypothetical protein